MGANPPNHLELPKLTKTMEETIENLDSPNQEQVVEQPTTYGLPEEPDDTPEDTEDIETLKQKNQELYEQLKKAKGFYRDSETGKWVKKEVPMPKPEIKFADDMTKEELYSLVKANVPDEDVSEVKAYARSHFITCTEALKKAEVKAILKIRDEFRRSAEVSNMSGSRKGNIKPNHEQILEQAREGKISDVDALVEARMARKMANMGKS